MRLWKVSKFILKIIKFNSRYLTNSLYKNLLRFYTKQIKIILYSAKRAISVDDIWRVAKSAQRSIKRFATYIHVAPLIVYHHQCCNNGHYDKHKSYIYTQIYILHLHTRRSYIERRAGKEERYVANIKWICWGEYCKSRMRIGEIIVVHHRAPFCRLFLIERESSLM